MMKLEKPQYKFVQYADGFCGGWGLGFSLIDTSTGYGWEFCPADCRLVNRDSSYPLQDNIDSGDTIFSYGFCDEVL